MSETLPEPEQSEQQPDIPFGGPDAGLRLLLERVDGITAAVAKKGLRSTLIGPKDLLAVDFTRIPEVTATA